VTIARARARGETSTKPEHVIDPKNLLGRDEGLQRLRDLLVCLTVRELLGGHERALTSRLLGTVASL
jgi:hypothetical protein